MTDARVTESIALAAVLAVVAAWAMAPSTPRLDLFHDRGDLLFPEFGDAARAESLEIVDSAGDHSAPRVVKIANRESRWVISTHSDYPADAGSRLGDITGAIASARKDDVLTDDPRQHGTFGVQDPFAASAEGAAGNGTRVVVRGRNDRLLADLIVGGTSDRQPTHRYVRLPGRNRVYLSGFGDLDLSASFEGWIERDLLRVVRDDIDEIIVRNYSVDERSGEVRHREALRLQRGRDRRWTVFDGQRTMVANPQRTSDLIDQLVTLQIAGVMPKPAGIAATLTRASSVERIAEGELRDLARKGFYLGPGGELLSNEGELIVHTRSGLFYTLRFGQLAPGFERVEHRYLFVMAAYDPAPAAMAVTASRDAEHRVRSLQARFAPWYYVISAGDFARLRPSRTDLLNQ